VDDGLAQIVIDVLIESDKRGVTTHGLTRLPGYIKRIETGLLDPHARPQIVADGGALVLLDGGNGFGAVAAFEATKLTAARAREHGVAWVTVRGSNHFGAAAYYSRWLAERGLASMVWSNASPAVAAYGGKRAVLGTNPISFAVPADGEPIVLDMATTTVARGKIRRAAAEGKPIAPGLALDVDGHPTTDAQAALKGTLASLGGYKGYGLAVMIELMSGVLSGGSFLTEVRQVTDLSGKSGACFTFIGADIDRITDRGAYLERIAKFRSTIRASGDAAATIYLPGDIEAQRTREAEAKGLSLPRDVLDAIKALVEA
jgi:LDH2 family malate/lactate/ureidoglycolate dehydrogenase